MRKIGFDEFVAMAMKAHGGKYTYDRESWQGWTQKVRAICPDHGEFFPYANAHVKRRTQCPECSYASLKRAVVSKEKRVAKLPKADGVILDVDGWDGNVNTEIKGVCVKHGEFSRTYYSLLRGKHPCPVCARIVGRQRGVKRSLNRFIKEAEEKFGRKFEYDVGSFKGMKRKMRIKCPEHGWFLMEPYSHLTSVTGCRRCGVVERVGNFVRRFSEFLSTARAVHGNKYVYDDRSYMSARGTVRIYCDEHGWFEQPVTVHLYQQSGCPACAHATRVSAEENEFFLWVEKEFGLDVQRQVKVGRLCVDGAVGNLLVDYHGSYWHSHHILGDRFAHQTRLLDAMSLGKTLVQVFDFDFLERRNQLTHFFKLRLGLLEPVAARLCRIGEVDPDAAEEFLRMYHLAAPLRGKHRVGLYYCGRLVGVMVVGRRHGRYEVLRYGVARPIIGGFARMFMHIARMLDVSEVVSFADARLFTGCVFRTAGFMLDSLTEPGYFYVKDRRYAGDRVAFQKHKLHKKLSMFDPSKSEYENCLKNGFFRVYDAGHWKWVWRRYNLAN